MYKIAYIWKLPLIVEPLSILVIKSRILEGLSITYLLIPYLLPSPSNYDRKI